MVDLIIEHVDSVNIRVRCERSVAKELSDFFTFKVPGHTYMPAYRNRIWDGQIKLYNMFSQTIYAGLEKYVVKFAEERGYKYERQIKEDNNFTEEIVEKYINEFLRPQIQGKTIPAHKHQIRAITHALRKDRTLLVSPTGSGKSMIIYALARYYFDKIPKHKKILVIVPTTSLVSQLYSDFAEYSGGGWVKNCHTVMAGKQKDDCKCRVIISTWQSIHKMPAEYFKKFEVVFGDECHLFKAKSLTSIMSKLVDCPIRIGTTGTLDGSLTHKLVIEGLFGPVFKVTTTKKLMDRKLLSDLKIDCLVLKHSESIRESMKRCTYQEEIDYIVGSQERNTFITDLTSRLKGNTLILFQYVDKHGKVLNEMMKQRFKDKKVFFVYGGTDTEQREQVRHIAEKTNDAVIIASYGTFSTGISIRRLHNIVFASPSKSRIRVLQSIGRQLRKSEHKDVAKLYDIADDLSWKKYKNHTLRHFEERLKIYEGEGFDFKPFHISLKESSDEQ